MQLFVLFHNCTSIRFYVSSAMVLFLAGGSFELVSAIVMAQWENSPCPVANCVCVGLVLSWAPAPFSCCQSDIGQTRGKKIGNMFRKGAVRLLATAAAIARPPRLPAYAPGRHQPPDVGFLARP